MLPLDIHLREIVFRVWCAAFAARAHNVGARPAVRGSIAARQTAA
jgi:hypothetical protein